MTSRASTGARVVAIQVERRCQSGLPTSNHLQNCPNLRDESPLCQEVFGVKAKIAPIKSKINGQNMENTQRNQVPSRESAWGLLCEYTQSENLRKHMLAVEACMRAYAKKFGESEHEYSLAGLLPDFDYEKYPLPEGFAQRGSALASCGN